MKIEVCFILFIEFWIVISGHRYPENPIWIVDSEPSTQHCERNEVFSLCAPLCEQQCNIQIKCQEGCEPKCVCRDGFIRNSQHKCIRRSHCPPPPSSDESGDSVEICFGEHKVYKKCGTPPECTPTCDNLKVNGDFCATVCDKGCFCEAGYVLDQYGECILAEACPISHSDACNKNPNEVYLSCGQLQGCVPTCDDPKLDIVCPAVCVDGCYCKTGYLKNSSGICVAEKDCPVSNNACSGPNESYLTCGTPLGCTPTCDDRKIDVLCITQCTQGCYCNAGYLRNTAGVCVREDECHVNKCLGANESYQTCGRPGSCTPTCDDRKSNVKCAFVCTEGCYCDNGYLRNNMGNCVLEHDCPPKNNTCIGEHKMNNDGKCIKSCNSSPNGDPSTCIGSHKVFKKCGLAKTCLPTCENPYNTRPCPKKCTEGCFCEEGYLVNQNGDCVKQDLCPPQKQCHGDHKYYDSWGKPQGFFPTCEDPLQAKPCPQDGVGGCYCEEGYLMNKRGDCISAEICFAENCTE